MLAGKYSVYSMDADAANLRSIIIVGGRTRASHPHLKMSPHPTAQKLPQQSTVPTSSEFLEAAYFTIPTAWENDLFYKRGWSHSVKISTQSKTATKAAAFFSCIPIKLHCVCEHCQLNLLILNRITKLLLVKVLLLHRRCEQPMQRRRNLY